jgi:hypothetical protein
MLLHIALCWHSFTTLHVDILTKKESSAMKHVPRPRKNATFQRWERYRYELARAYILACIAGERPKGLASVGKTYHYVCQLARVMRGSRYAFKRIAECLRYRDEPQMVKLLADIRRAVRNSSQEKEEEELVG